MAYRPDTDPESDAERGAPPSSEDDAAPMKDELEHSSIDAWEPSLLRRLREVRNDSR